MSSLRWQPKKCNLFIKVINDYKKNLHGSITFTRYYIHTIYFGETLWLSKNV
ncbi:hypothetical protein H206_06951 [Candidatus Electrothrix aarhusensis]|uniref:Uncharacterized protein n=1 Tax=Candidatus Electrothrix aarhusensis TaxID=1859131 RepID=A0A444J3K0_9BACT|nr:hypothetical protein H206_06951 [Candidatus Electrothrix aarhusensis]